MLTNLQAFCKNLASHDKAKHVQKGNCNLKSSDLPSDALMLKAQSSQLAVSAGVFGEFTLRYVIHSNLVILSSAANLHLPGH